LTHEDDRREGSTRPPVAQEVRSLFSDSESMHEGTRGLTRVRRRQLLDFDQVKVGHWP